MPDYDCYDLTGYVYNLFSCDSGRAIYSEQINIQPMFSVGGLQAVSINAGSTHRELKIDMIFSKYNGEDFLDKAYQATAMIKNPSFMHSVRLVSVDWHGSPSEDVRIHAVFQVTNYESLRSEMASKARDKRDAEFYKEVDKICST